MSPSDSYTPGAAFGADVRKEGERWTLVLVRELRHAPDTVWAALTEPGQLREWAPFDADRNLGSVGAVTLSTVGAPMSPAAESRVMQADPPRLLALSWGGQALRWELRPLDGGGTRLELWHDIDRGFISMGAAGWHICLDVLDRALAGRPVGRIVGAEALKFEGWQRLNAEYARQFGVEPPSWTVGAAQG